MRYSSIDKCVIADGIGVRVSLFVSGCRNCCKGCFNQKAQDFNYGSLFTQDTENYIFNLIDKEYIKGITIVGGEPLEPENQDQLVVFLKHFRERYSHTKNIWLYTGYILDKNIPQTSNTKELLSYIDVLVDGPFELDRKCLNIAFRGSTNQRIIDMNYYNKHNIVHELQF